MSCRVFARRRLRNVNLRAEISRSLAVRPSRRACETAMLQTPNVLTEHEHLNVVALLTLACSGT